MIFERVKNLISIFMKLQNNFSMNYTQLKESF